MKKVFKKATISAIFLGLIFSVFSCNNIEKKTETETEGHSHSHDENATGHSHSHTHYEANDTIPAHKLLYPSKVPDRIIANVPEDAATMIAVNWRTNQQINNAVLEVAVATDGPEFQLGDIKCVNAKTEVFENKHVKHNEPLVKANYHSASITGLEPKTTYVYRVGSNELEGDTLWSEWFQYTTASDKTGEEFSFIYFGDAQNQVKSMWSRVIRNSYRKFPSVDFMLHAGDLINDHDSNLQWGEWFYSGSFIHATVPSIMTPGNHEYKDTTLTPLWQPQFNLPKNGPKGISEISETTYAVDYQDLKVISIDCINFDRKDEHREAQVQWLDSILKNNTKKWTALTMHFPLYTPAQKREDNAVLIEHLKPLIDKYKVDLVLQGHDHTYARGQISNKKSGVTTMSDAGTIYAVSVSGPKMYESTDKKWIERRGEFTQLFQIITIKGNKLSYEAYTPIGTLYDAFDLTKTGNKKILKNRIPDTPVRLKSDFTR
ncbi:metallophosphoesterase family protein [Zunongwangia sp. SCSIO 43204]|uniref:purple acid phosphatase family protein n=1 Tax=Zunongwangia sp. SCSIO 43204 TaxID=2779359 RepID=UPI001CA83E5B|nr:metallophosphoesterase family protein [Zunongwangia sp. SCSIO 43204]UAB83243.1 metallophosphoesterase family protein [Zunongwangia sp. SCSIO 43204]